MDAEIIPLPKRRLYRDYDDIDLQAAIYGCRERLSLARITLRKLLAEAEYRGLEVD